MAGHGQSGNDFDVLGNLLVTGITNLGQTTQSGSRTIQIQSSDTNAGLTLSTKGTGTVQVNSGYEGNISSDQDLINKGYFRQKLLSLATSSILQSPTITQNGYSVVWDNLALQFTLRNIASNTFNNGITQSGINVQLGGALVQNTDITGGGSAAYGVRLGLLTDQLNNFQVWSAGTITLFGTLGATIYIGQSGLGLVQISSAAGSSIRVTDSGISIDINPALSSPRGITGNADYSANITANDFTQKVYTDKTLVGKSVSSTLLSPGSSQNGYAITWDNVAGKFTLSPNGSGGGSSSLSSLTDVNITSPSDGDLFQYRTSDNKWHNFSLAGDSTIDNTGNITTIGLKSKSLPSLSAGFLKYSGSAWIFDNSTYLTSNQTITLSGDVSGSGTTSITVSVDKFNGQLPSYYLLTTNIIEGSNLYFTNARAIGATLTGYVSGSGTISSSDSILGAIQKLNGNIGLLTGAVIYQGTWNANTNSPTLTSGTGTKGFMYKVSVAGSTNLDGITQWNVGDQAIFNGTVWDKIDGIASEVLSIFGRVGAVVGAAADYSGVAMTGITSLNGLVITANTGVITTGTWNATTISPTHGGTGLTSATKGDILYASATNTWASLAAVATGSVLGSKGVGNAPGYLTVNNGLTASSSTVQLGGSLIQDTTITIDGFTYLVSDSSNFNYFYLDPVNSQITGQVSPDSGATVYGFNFSPDSVQTSYINTGTLAIQPASSAISSTSSLNINNYNTIQIQSKTTIVINSQTNNTGAYLRAGDSSNTAIVGVGTVGSAVTGGYISVGNPGATYQYQYFGVNNTTTPTSGFIQQITYTDNILRDCNPTTKGLQYFADYSSGFVSLSLVHKGFVLGAKTFTGLQTFLTSTTGSASLNIPNGATPTSPNNNDIWGQGNHLYVRLNGVTYQLDQQASGGGIVGYANGGTNANTSWTQGSIFFAGASAFTQDNSNLFYDNTGKTLLLGGNTNTVFANDRLVASGSVNSYLQIVTQNSSSGTTASTDIVATADTGNDSTNFINFGINSSGNTDTNLPGALAGYLYTNGGNLLLATQSAKDIVFYTNGLTAAQERFRIISGGGTTITGAGAVPTLQIIAVGSTTNYTIRFFQSGGSTEILSQKDSGSMVLTQTAQSVSWLPVLKIVGGANTSYTTATEFIDVDLSLNRTLQWASGTVATQRMVYLRGATLSGASATATFTDPYTLYIDGPVIGTNAAFTNGPWIIGGASTNTIFKIGSGIATNGEPTIYLARTGSSGFTKLSLGTSSGAINAGIWVNGTGEVRIGALSTGGFFPTIYSNNAEVARFPTTGDFLLGSTTDSARLYIKQAALSSAWVPGLRIDLGAHTGMTTATEFINFDLQGATQTAASGTTTTQRNFYIRRVTYAGTSGTRTITNGYGLYVEDPAAGTNGAITNKYGIGIDGNLALVTAGNKLYIKTGSNASAGTGTLTAGTVTISTTACTASSLVFITDTTSGALTNVGTLTVVASSGSFTVKSTNALDTSTFNWFIIEPTP